MPVMPLPIEKGYICELLEIYLDAPDNRAKLINELRNPNVQLWQCGVIADDPAAQIHIRDHWLGGWMQKWKGDADAISRQTLLRGLEVACGLSREEMGVDAVVAPMPSHHPLDIFMTCGAEQFQGFVSWRSTVDQPRRVQVILSAPDYGPPDYHYWLGIVADDDTNEVFEPNGRDAIAASRALWVIGQTENERVLDGDFISAGPVKTAVVQLGAGGYSVDTMPNADRAMTQRSAPDLIG